MRSVHLGDDCDRMPRHRFGKPQASEREANFFEGKRWGCSLRSRLSLAKVPPALDCFAPKRLFGRELIVRPTSNTEISSVVRATERLWRDVIELQERA